MIDESWAQVLVEEEFHAAGGMASRRSRAAANARQARMSSRVRLGKSARIWSSVIPPAKYSRTSYTVIRVPRTHGLLLRTPGAIVIRSSRFIIPPYAPNAPCYPGLFRRSTRSLLPQKSSRPSASGQGRAAQRKTPGGPAHPPGAPRAGSRPPRVPPAGVPTRGQQPGAGPGRQLPLPPLCRHSRSCARSRMPSSGFEVGEAPRVPPVPGARVQGRQPKLPPLTRAPVACLGDGAKENARGAGRPTGRLGGVVDGTSPPTPRAG